MGGCGKALLVGLIGGACAYFVADSNDARVRGWGALALLAFPLFQYYRVHRALRRTRARVEELEGRAAALRFDATTFYTWNDARLEATYTELDSVSGADGAAELRREIAAQREAASFMERPARGWRVWTFAAVVCAAIVLAMHLVHGG